MHIKNNRLLLGSLLALVVYFGGGPFLDRPYLSSTVSLLFMGASTGLVVFYWRAFVDVVFKHRRLAEDPGSHIGVFGAILAGMGGIISALFNLIWVRYGSPPDWNGTVFSNFGRIVIAAGFACLVISPHVGRVAAELPRQTTLIVFSIIGIIIAFTIGTQIRPAEIVPAWSPVWYDSDRPICLPNRPVWGVSSSKIYHVAESRYRSLVIPDHCFASEWEAKVAGYRPPAAP